MLVVRRILLMLLFFGTGLCQAQGWTWQNPVPHSAWIFDVRGLPGQPGAASAVGAYGTIIRKGAGRGWTLLSSGVPDGLRSHVWLDANTAVAVGDRNTILLTRDGGLHWERRRGGPGERDSLQDVSFGDSTHGIAVGGSGTILQTLDGGLTWNPLDNPFSGKEDVAFQAVFVRGPGPVITVLGTHPEPGNPARGLALYSKDGGASWDVAFYSETQGFDRLHFHDSDRGFAVARFGKIFRTEDGGRVWELVYQGAATSNLSDVHFVDPLTGWASGSVLTANGIRPLLLRTDDGGTSWQAQNVPGEDSLQSVFFPNGQAGWVVGSGGTILYTKTQGSRWVQQRHGPVVTLRGVSFADSRTGWAAGKGVLHTRDAGTTWRPQSSDLFRNACFQDVAATATMSAVAVGFRRENDPRACDLAYQFDPNDTGVILLTRDGGQTWQAPDTLIKQKVLRRVQFRDVENGWIVGGETLKEPGFALRTADGGDTWKEVTIDPGSTLPFHSVFFASAAVGWITGEGGIYKTTDGGATWTRQHPGYAGSSYFLNQNVGWVVGPNRTLLGTTNGGATWISWPLVSDDGFSPDLNRLAFVDENDGMATGSGGNLSRDDGTVHRTRDGGRTWRRQVRSQGSDVYFGLARIDTDTAWAVGYNGTILYTASGGE